jgi:uncharacterized membrane-anchored protein
MHLPVNAALTSVVSIPLVAVVVALSVRRVRRLVERRDAV